MRVYQFRHIRAERQCSASISLPFARSIFVLRRGLLICGLVGTALAAAPSALAEPVQVVVTLKEPALAQTFAARKRSLAYSSFARPKRLLLQAPASRTYLRRLAASQAVLYNRIRSAIPTATRRWSYGVVLNGFAVVVPRARLSELTRLPGVERVWPNRRYGPLLDRTPTIIGAPSLWGPTLATAGQGMKIAVIDDGIDQTHPFFAPRGLTYPAGFPKGQTAYTTPKVIVARAFPPPSAGHPNASRPFDPENSEHGTHVAGIAAGNDGTRRQNVTYSGIAPRAYLGNYKALTMPSQFGLNGNAPELAAAVEAAVRDGMDVINLSIGEPEIEPSRDLVVRALNAAADAGVVSTVAAGNDFSEFGYGSVGSPASAAKTIAAAASSGGRGSGETDTTVSFSSAGPTTYSLQLKPDVTAPGEGVASARPGGTFGELSGTSMAAPHVAGAAAVLRQRHPTWAPGQIKSALMLTGAPVRGNGGGEVSPLREGGGRIDLVRADHPFVFTAPTNLSFGLLRPGNAAAHALRVTDAGGGAGAWSVQYGSSMLSGPAQVVVPGTVSVRAAVPRGARQRDVSGFVVLSRGGERRRVPFWFRIAVPRLPSLPRRALVRPGLYSTTTAVGVSRVSSYRYPEVPAGAGFPVRLVGREVVYRVRVRRPANFGVAVVAQGRGVRVEPRIVRAGDENRLAGYTALPLDLNPYRASYGRPRPVAGVVLPGPGSYDIVFDTPRSGRPGGFRFRYWVGDTTPPSVRVLGVRGNTLQLSLADAGAGVDPASLTARVDGNATPVSFRNSRAIVSLAAVRPGRHALEFTVADYQETKNMEDVAGITPNTRTVRATFVLR